MGFLLLWVESLAVSLLFMAWVFACVGRWRRRWLRGGVVALGDLVVLMIYLYLAVYAGRLQFSGTLGFRWFYYALVLAISVFVGAVALHVIGLSRTRKTALPAVASRWPRGKLFAAWCVVLGLHLFTIGNLDQAARQQLEAIRRDAIAQMRAATPPPVPDSENAAILYEVAADAFSDSVPFSSEEEDQRKWLEGVLEAFDGKDPVVKRFVEEKGFVVRILQKAAGKSSCVVDPSYERPFAVSSQSFSHASHATDGLAMLLAIHSRWKLANGDRREAFQDVDTLFQLAKHMSNAQLLWPANVMKNQAERTLQHLLLAVLPTAEELEIIHIDEFWSCRRTELRNWPMVDSQLRWCLHGWGCEDDFARSFGMFESFSPSLGRFSNSPWYRIFLLQNDLAIVDRISSETQSQLSVPYWDALKRQRENNFWRERTLERPGLPGVTVALFAVQILGDLPKLCAMADARHDTAVVAVAVARFQAKHGRLPKNLDALVPEFLAMVPQDPFDGKPIRYETTDSGVVVFSVGRDTVEAGDVSGTATMKRKKCGMTFELPRWNP